MPCTKLFIPLMVKIFTCRRNLSDQEKQYPHLLSASKRVSLKKFLLFWAFEFDFCSLHLSFSLFHFLLIVKSPTLVSRNGDFFFFFRKNVSRNEFFSSTVTQALEMRYCCSMLHQWFVPLLSSLPSIQVFYLPCASTKSN